jgi:hypothetical protein
MYEIHPQSSFFIHNGWDSFITWHSSTCMIFIHFYPFSSIMYEIHSQHTKFIHYCPSSFIIKLFVKSNKHGTKNHVCLYRNHIHQHINFLKSSWTRHKSQFCIKPWHELSIMLSYFAIIKPITSSSTKFFFFSWFVLKLFAFIFSSYKCFFTMVVNIVCKQKWKVYQGLKTSGRGWGLCHTLLIHYKSCF